MIALNKNSQVYLLPRGPGLGLLAPGPPLFIWIEKGKLKKIQWIQYAQARRHFQCAPALVSTVGST